MSAAQIRAIAILGALSALDGYDVLSITFAAPGISSDWAVTKGTLGIILSMGLLGMGLGSFLLAPLADRFGRRPLVFTCLSLMAIGMLASAFAGSVPVLGFWRLVTGVGIGAMVATIAPLAAEFSNAKRRPLAVAVMALGYPVGGVIGGFTAAFLLQAYSWHAVFLLGFVAAALLMPAIYLWVPESVSFLLARKTATSAARLERTVRQFGLSHVPLAPVNSSAQSHSAPSIFRGRALIGTLHLGLVNFLNVIAAYYLLSWMPQLVADAGFSHAAGTMVSVTASICGVAGGILLGWLGSRYPIKPFVVGTIICMGLATFLFGAVPDELVFLMIAAGTAGFFLYPGAVGIFNVIAEYFPAESRVTGSGFVMGVGRGGSAIAPLLAGYLFQSGFDRAEVSAVMASSALAGGLLLAFLKVGPSRAVARPGTSPVHSS